MRSHWSVWTNGPAISNRLEDISIESILMSTQISPTQPKFPDKVYVCYSTRSELDLLEVIDKIRNTGEFSEEDLEYRQEFQALFVRPGVLPLLNCRELKSPLYSWSEGVFKETVIIRFKYECLSQLDWDMVLDIQIPSTDYQYNLIEVVCRGSKISCFTSSDEDKLKLSNAMGLNKLKEYYERESI